jgi:hypothetical protein
LQMRAQDTLVSVVNANIQKRSPGKNSSIIEFNFEQLVIFDMKNYNASKNRPPTVIFEVQTNKI